MKTRIYLSKQRVNSIREQGLVIEHLCPGFLSKAVVFTDKEFREETVKFIQQLRSEIAGLGYDLDYIQEEHDNQKKEQDRIREGK